LPQRRIIPAMPVQSNQHRSVLSRALFPVAPARPDGRRGDARGSRHGAHAVAAGDALPVLAGGAPRSGRSAALRMSAMADKDPVLFLDAVERRYHQGESILEILGGAELAVWPGQSVALIGPSGAGKSTLLHIAGLLEHPDAGEGQVGGLAPPHLPG